MRVWWYAGRYLPGLVIGVMAVLADRLSAAIVLTVSVVGPAVIALVCERARDGGFRRLGVDLAGKYDARRRWRAGLLAMAWSWYFGVAVWFLGFWAIPCLAAGLTIGLVARRTGRIGGARPIDTAVLPPSARRLLAPDPQLKLLAVPDGRYPFKAFATAPDRIYIAESLLAGDPEELSAIVAHEIAHHRLGLTEARVTGMTLLLDIVSVGWLFAIAVGRMPATLNVPSPHSPFTPAIVTILTGMFIGRAALEPLGLWRSRERERNTDRLALEMLGSGQAYARWVERQAAMIGPQPRMFHALSSRHPTPAEIIATALTYDNEASQE